MKSNINYLVTYGFNKYELHWFIRLLIVCVPGPSKINWVIRLLFVLLVWQIESSCELFSPSSFYLLWFCDTVFVMHNVQLRFQLKDHNYDLHLISHIHHCKVKEWPSPAKDHSYKYYRNWSLLQPCVASPLSISTYSLNIEKIHTEEVSVDMTGKYW